MKLYVASSWRNAIHPFIVNLLREAGHEVYDYRNPGPGQHGYSWSEIDPAWEMWSPEEFRQALRHPIAQAAFASDHNAMDTADGCVLVLPCNRSAHLEAGEFPGSGRPLWILLNGHVQPELMYLSATGIALDPLELVGMIAELGQKVGFVRIEDAAPEVLP